MSVAAIVGVPWRPELEPGDVVQEVAVEGTAPVEHRVDATGLDEHVAVEQITVHEVSLAWDRSRPVRPASPCRPERARHRRATRSTVVASHGCAGRGCRRRRRAGNRAELLPISGAVTVPSPVARGGGQIDGPGRVEGREQRRHHRLPDRRGDRFEGLAVGPRRDGEEAAVGDSRPRSPRGSEGPVSEPGCPSILLEVLDELPDADDEVAISMAEAEAARPGALAHQFDRADVGPEVFDQEVGTSSAPISNPLPRMGCRNFSAWYRRRAADGPWRDTG